MHLKTNKEMESHQIQNKTIKFNEPLQLSKQKDYLLEVFNEGKFSGDGSFTKKCHELLEKHTSTKKALLTTSCSHALEMTALLANIKAGDEIIMPSFTFVSTANAFVLQGARIVFVDIRPDTMNIDEKKIEAAITNKTKAIVPVHYGGVSCDMDFIVSIAKKYNLLVIEDAAQCIGSYYKGKPVGILGNMSCFSFHETKNIHSGEGGALFINENKYIERAEIIREKGTNRSRFLRGQVDKYTWVDVGSSYLPSELNAAILYAQLEQENEITSKRLKIWEQYYSLLSILQDENKIELPRVPVECKHNAHLFFIKLKDIDERQNMIDFLLQRKINTAFHYIPLHSADAGKLFGVFHGEDQFTTKESERLLRLPMHLSLSIADVEKICHHIIEFFNK